MLNQWQTNGGEAAAWSVADRGSIGHRTANGCASNSQFDAANDRTFEKKT